MVHFVTVVHFVTAIYRRPIGRAMMRYLDEASVRAVLHWDPLIAAMEQALTAFSGGRVIQPVRNRAMRETG